MSTRTSMRHIQYAYFKRSSNSHYFILVEGPHYHFESDSATVSIWERNSLNIFDTICWPMLCPGACHNDVWKQRGDQGSFLKMLQPDNANLGPPPVDVTGHTYYI